MYSLEKIVAVLFLISLFKVNDGKARSIDLPLVCNSWQATVLPCVCCRKSCWMGVTDITTALFGHIPGEKSDSEAQITLSMVRACFKTECLKQCKV